MTIRTLVIAATAMTLATAAHAQDTAQNAPASAEPKRTLMPEAKMALAFQQQYGFSDAVIHGDTVYLSGVVAEPGACMTDEEAYDRAFTAIARTLERAGSSWDDVLDITTFHTDLDAQIEEFAEVKNRYVKAPFPTWTAIGITRLYGERGLVEIKVVARVR